MTTIDAQNLKKRWHAAGGGWCSHENLQRTQMPSGYVTGDYACLACGTDVRSPD